MSENGLMGQVPRGRNGTAGPRIYYAEHGKVKQDTGDVGRSHGSFCPKFCIGKAAWGNAQAMGSVIDSMTMSAPVPE